jgi:hypothetical protein
MNNPALHFKPSGVAGESVISSVRPLTASDLLFGFFIQAHALSLAKVDCESLRSPGFGLHGHPNAWHILQGFFKWINDIEFFFAQSS